MFNIVLVNPQIPPNTGNIGRLCVATNSKLHIVKPIGFDMSEKALKRAGLDYWKDLNIEVHESIDEFLEKYPIDDRHFFATTKAIKYHFQAKFQPNDFLYFGREDAGLDINLMKNNELNMIKIPMSEKTRSINLATAVSVVLYEAIRQNFEEFETIF
ncbi:MAG: tRNA (cytidine(34)-2'-O)-methyltransferase [Campylobacterales bacterium]|nr:tRNA (cytidine(34)-2'-O)-methyltransferase [Campylobacterales bacterium]